MIVDTSAIVAVLRGEPDAAVYERIIATASTVRISAASYVELGVIVDGTRDPVLSGVLDSFLDESRISIEPLTADQARAARVAYQRFGKGSGHAARLNFGDCFAYAVARVLGEPLLFKGQDFALTDIEIVIEPIKSHRLSEIVTRYQASAVKPMESDASI